MVKVFFIGCECNMSNKSPNSPSDRRQGDEPFYARHESFDMVNYTYNYFDVSKL